MPKRSQAWKELERQTAEALGGKRIVRYDFFAPPCADVVLEDMPEVSIDCKHRARWQCHSLLHEIKGKYHGTPILVTKGRGEHGAVASMPLNYFAEVLDEMRTWRRVRAEIQHRLKGNETELARAQRQRALLDGVAGADRPRAEWDRQIARVEGHIACLRALEDIVTAGPRLAER